MITNVVDSCFHLAVAAFRRRRQGWSVNAALEWTSSRMGRLLLTARIRKMGSQAEGEATAPPEFLLTAPTLTQLIRLVPSKVTFGMRYWLVCPECYRRCGKLYLQRDDQGLFRCRRCLGLRYESEMHDCDWFYRPLAAKTGIPKRMLRRYYHEIGRKAMADAGMYGPDGVGGSPVAEHSASGRGTRPDDYLSV